MLLPRLFALLAVASQTLRVAHATTMRRSTVLPWNGGAAFATAIAGGCGSGATLKQSFDENLNAASAQPFIGMTSGTYSNQGGATNPHKASGRRTGAWEGCCLMDGAIKANDPKAGGQTTAATLSKGATLNLSRCMPTGIDCLVLFQCLSTTSSVQTASLAAPRSPLANPSSGVSTTD